MKVPNGMNDENWVIVNIRGYGDASIPCWRSCSIAMH